MGGLIDVIESSILPVVSKVAPLLGSVLGTPLAGVAISLLAKAFGVNPNDTSKLSEALTADPEATLKIKQVEYEHADTLAQIASTDYATEVDDRKSARTNSAQYKDFMRHMAYLVTLGFFGALFVLFLPIETTSEEKNLLSMLVGMLASKWQTIIDFFYGSSRHNSQGAIK